MSTQASKRLRLSVAMIVRDAQRRLEQTIQSVAEIADELIIVDTGSVDDTIERAVAAGATVLERPWDASFSTARNFCLKNTTGDWVLWLDAGETIDVDTATALRTFVDSQADPSKAYMLFVELAPESEIVSGERIGRVRLIPRRDDLEFKGRICEQMTDSFDRAGIVIEPLALNIQRPASDHAADVKRAKANRDVKLAKIELAEGGARPAVMVAAGAALANLGQKDEASTYFRRAIKASERGSTEMLEAYYGLLTAQDGDPSKREIQIAICIEALDVYPLDAQLLCGMGSYMLAQNRLDLAARSYRLAVNHSQIDPATWHLSAISEVATICLSLTLQLQAKDDEAQEVLEESLQRHADSVAARRQLLELHIKRGKLDEAMATFEGLPRTTPNREALRSAVRGALLAVNKNWLAATPYLKTAYSAGCRDPLCLRWLSITYLSTDQIDLATPILKEWHQLEPFNAEVATYMEAAARRKADDTQDPEPVADTPHEPGQTAPIDAARHLRVDPADPTVAPDMAAPLGAQRSETVDPPPATV